MGWNLWAWLKTQVDAALYCPCAAPGILAQKLVEQSGVSYVLKNPTQGTYLKLAEPDYEMWQLMDGSRTIKDLVVAYFVKRKAFAFGRIAALADELRAGYFLTDQPVGVYRQAREQLTQRDWTYRWRQLAKGFLDYTLPLAGLDGFFGRLYRLTRWLFTWPAQAILERVVVVGFVAFLALLISGRYAILVTGGSYWWGLAALLVANSIVLVIHEFAHALTTKHYGREVRRGGFMIYYGMPAFFVDTMDIWLEPKAHRIAVSWAGPYSGLIVGGVCSLLAALLPDPLAGQLFFKTAFVGYLLFFVNLNPLLELDGYFMLIDWLEMPMLRQRSFEFIRRELWGKVVGRLGDKGASGQVDQGVSRQGDKGTRGPGDKETGRQGDKGAGRQVDKEVSGRGDKGTRGQGDREAGQQRSRARVTLTREERVLTAFGAAAAAYTVYSLLVAIYFWQTRLTLMLADLWDRQGWFGKSVVLVVSSGILIPLALALFATAWNAGRRLIEWLDKRRFFDSYRNVLLALAGLIAALVLAPTLLDDPWWTAYQALGPIVLLGVACASLLATARQHEGAEIQYVFLALVAAAVMLLAAQLMRSLALAAGARSGSLIAAMSALESLAALPLVLAGYWSLQRIDLRDTYWWERAVMGTLIALGFLIVVPLALWSTFSGPVWGLPAIAAPYLVVVFFAAILPTLVAYARTRFFVPWLALIGAALVTGASGVLRAWPDWPRWSDYDLWLNVLAAAGWALGALAYAAAGWRLRFEPSHWSDDLALSDKERLRAAFARFFQALFAGFRMTFGARRAQSVDDSMDVASVAADWNVEIESGHVRDELDLDKITILEQADRYREVLSRAIDLMDDWSGSHFIARATQAAYDSLPWPEREILGQYVLAGMPWGRTIAQEFASARSDRDRLIRGVPILAGCSDRAFALILAAAQPQTVRAHMTLAKQGAPADRFVVVQSGSIEKWVQATPAAPAQLVGTLRRGASFGAEVFIGGGQYSGDYRAAMDTEILVISSEEAGRLMRAGVKLAARVGATLSATHLLGQMPMFADLGPQQLAALAQHLGRQTVAPGQVIIRQGEPRHHFYIVAQGQVEIIVRGPEDASRVAERMVKRLGVGEHFGETALFADAPYSATVRAVEPTVLLTLDEPAFDKLVGGSIRMTHYVEQVSSGRAIETRRKMTAVH